MLRKSIHQTFSSVFLVVSLSLYSLNVFSEDMTAKVEFTQWLGPDIYTVTASSKQCIDYVTPSNLQLFPEYPQTITIHYLADGVPCRASPSIELFEVKDILQPDKVARFEWLLYAQGPTLTEVHDPYGLLSFDTSDPFDIKVWVSPLNQSRPTTSNSN
ncbi:hypothetical protein [Endozoicomonas sp. 4G]|uniref:hypothetical protein n=1 Tax=Endozoicomonas sp. 4G TaxID=2872754 RepID=UPI0020788385|nr:hypothetical protein [Endozoicomonas sp. 4G]